MARIIKDYHIFPYGIAPDERTAVCIDDAGQAVVIGEGKATLYQRAKSFRRSNVNHNSHYNGKARQKH